MNKQNIIIPIGESVESQHILKHIPDFFPPERNKLVLIQVTEKPDDPTGAEVPNVIKLEVKDSTTMPAEIAYEIPTPKTAGSPEEIDVSPDVKPDVYTSQVEERHHYEVQDKLQEIAKPLRELGYEIATIVQFGKAAEEIVRFVEAGEESIDLIAMTTHGRSGLDRLLKGSVAEDILHNTHTPLFLVRPPAS